MIKNWNVHVFDEVESTNLLIKQAISKGEGAGFVAVAAAQSGGYGMRGHKWVSPKGSLYMSCLFDVKVTHEQFNKIPLSFAQATMPVLQKMSSEELIIKEPNDIILRQADGEKLKKLAGISTEIYREKLCVGIGVNIFRPQSNEILPLEDQSKNEIAYLSENAISDITIDSVREQILNAWTCFL